MPNMGKECFVVSVGKDLSVVGPFTESAAVEVANTGVGTINYVVKSIAVVDRTSITPAEVAEEVMKLLGNVLQGRRHSSSPQCLPVAQYRELEKLSAQYRAAVEAHQGE